MARNKHSTALFEVIHSANRPERIAQSLRTPKWWFKSGHKPPVTTPPAAQIYSEPELVAEYQSEPEIAPTRKRIQAVRGQGASRFRLGFDRARQELTFRLRYTTVLVTGFAVCSIVGVSYIVGRHLGSGPKSAAAADQASIKELQQQPPQPGVTAVVKPATPAQPLAARPQSAKASEATHQPALATNTLAPKRDVGSSLVPASADTTQPRKPGLNYLVIASYSPDRLAGAQAARDYFTKNGIPCTLEKTGWTLGNNWVTLIGTAGFPKGTTEDFEGYVNRTAALAKSLKTPNFDRPMVTTMNRYSWRATDGSSN
jgi:hypothetical protein